ncbi:MAG: quinolinate synthetase complex, subunit, partial [Pseudomonadota bacterium]
MQTATIKFERFQAAGDDDLQQRIIAAKAKLGKRLVILGHHYQQESVYRHADYTGDSLKLSR